MGFITRIALMVGSARNMKALAHKAAHGVQHVQKMSEAIKANRFSWMFQEARRGDVDKQFEVAESYYRGRGIDQSFTDAAIWYHRAAQGGHSEAQSIVGMMLLVGRGMTKDPVEAGKWIELAAAQGEESALNNRPQIRKKLTDVQWDEAKARAREFRPSSWKNSN